MSMCLCMLAARTSSLHSGTVAAWWLKLVSACACVCRLYVLSMCLCMHVMEQCIPYQVCCSTEWVIGREWVLVLADCVPCMLAAIRRVAIIMLLPFNIRNTLICVVADYVQNSCVNTNHLRCSERMCRNTLYIG